MSHTEPSGTPASPGATTTSGPAASAATAPRAASAAGPDRRTTDPGGSRSVGPGGGTAPTRPAVIPLHALLLACLGLGCVGLAGVLHGLWWVWPVAATVILVLVVTAAARRLRLPSALVTVCGLAALLLALTVLHLGDHALLGFIPTSGTFTAAGRLWREAAAVGSGQAAPYAPGPGLAFLLSALAGLVAVFMETALVGLRMAGVACLGLLALLAVPALTLPGSVSPLGVAAAVLAALALLAGARVWGASRNQRIAPAPGGLPRTVVVVVGVLAATLLVPAVMPGFFNGAFPQGSSLTSERAPGVGPLRGVGQDLRAQQPTQRFTYTTADGRPRYMRLMTLSDFSQPEFFPDTDHLDGDLARIADPGANPVSRDRPVAARVTFDDYSDHWLPLPYAPVELSGLGRDGWSWNPRDLSVHSDATGMSGRSFTVTSSAPEASPEALRAAPSSASDAAMAEYLRVPADRPASLDDAAREITRGLDNDYAKALALQNTLRTTFRYDVNAPLTQGYDAGGMAGLDKFMRTRAGYSGHFAPAMALLARETGIPARVAVGYLPTPAVAGPGGEHFAVGTGEAHAWPELYFQGVGWVRFEPTPGIPTTPDYAPESGDPTGGEGGGQPSQPPSQEPGSSASPSENPGSEPAPEPSQAPVDQAQQPAAVLVPWWLPAAIALVVVLLVLAVLPRVIRARRRTARLAAMADPQRPVRERSNAAWAELQDLAVDHGAVPRPADTPRVRAGRIAAAVPAAGEAVERILADVEHANYAAPDAAWRPAASPEDLGTLREELMRKASAAQRRRATWWPTSVLGGRREERRRAPGRR